MTEQPKQNGARDLEALGEAAQRAGEDFDYLPPDVRCTCGMMSEGIHYPGCDVARYRHGKWRVPFVDQASNVDVSVHGRPTVAEQLEHDYSMGLTPDE